MSEERGVGRTVIAGVARALKRAGMPPMDERLKSIVGRQVLTLHKGGWPTEEIQQAATDLALAWDERRGHNRLTHLAQRLRLLDADRQRREHAARMAAERADVATLKDMPLLAGKPHPGFHDFSASPQDRSSCALCGGPLGVHVKPRVEVSA